MLLDPSRKRAEGHSALNILETGRAVIDLEAEALKTLSSTLDEMFTAAVGIIFETQGRTVITGMGKSGHIGRKFAATLSSTGTPAIFVHPSEAAHGDLGMLLPGDSLIVLSYSGATQELRAILRHAQLLGCPIIGVSARTDSPLMTVASVRLMLPAAREACPANIAPTTSTTLMLALGDALAITVMGLRGVSLEILKALHPGGIVGSRLQSVDDVMHDGDALPLVGLHCPMRDVILTMTAKSFGIAGVVDDEGRLSGVITDGDLRRHIDQLLHSTAADIMSHDPQTMPQGGYVEEALALISHHKIGALFVMDRDAPQFPVGLIHIHDLARIGLA